MKKYVVELPELLDPDALKLNGFEMADRKRAIRELKATQQRLAQQATDQR